MDTKLMNLNPILSWFKSTGHYFLLVFFIITVSVLTYIIVDKHIQASKPVEPPPSQVSFDHESALKRIDSLEKQLEMQSSVIKKLETDLSTQAAANKVLEKRLQFHSDVFRRICEYVVVITVDKKIIPRQCLSDYNWRREEGL